MARRYEIDIMYEKIIQTLEKLVRERNDLQVELGIALGVLRFAEEHKISHKSNVYTIPLAEDGFGYFQLLECDEVGNSKAVVLDANGVPEEIIGGSRIIL